MIELIGTNAGLVWNSLDKLGKMDIKALKKATKLRSDKELYAALGWLAKEGKLHFDESGEDLLIELVY
ncbi:hypothetical protein HMPREF1556_00846 [Porphyromonas sp. oral taxon 278 str. W7784]|jgi:hypothetical protein|uniref:winged helix-turn-helix domain-containing protein n=1 Tax=Porphyromonas sp. oral taxon 278 TaxID=712437 RepID=UPI0003AD09CD|nr:winged helix-turn-helix domain-containing protein [Porphyromonas sp. oral taxon 278]ERJ72238.1 hypothetical protein HMPREF1556_00846 [Porphyromonas sp. oral taxon 278 str. W7784]